MATTLEASTTASGFMTPKTVSILGPKLAAELTEPSDWLYEQIELFAQHLATMTDDDIRTQFHCGDDLVESCRELQHACGR